MSSEPVLDHLALQCDARMEHLQTLMDAVQSFCRRAGLEEEALQDFRVAVEEACVNVIRYAYSGQPVGSIALDVRFSEDEGKPAIMCALRDHGAPFNPLTYQLPDINAPAEARDIGGLGVMLMRQMSDRLLWKFDALDGNCLTLIKHIQLPSAATPL